MTLPDTPDECRLLTDEQVADLLALTHDLEQLDRHGPEAPGLSARIAARRARLSASGISLEDQPT